MKVQRTVFALAAIILTWFVYVLNRRSGGGMRGEAEARERHMEQLRASARHTHLPMAH